MSTATSTVSAGSTRAKSSPNLLRKVRQMHLYLGIFFAPAIVFFSLTGAAQVLNLHETQPGSTYQPPAWLEKMAQVHKKQTLVMRPKAPPRPGPGATPDQPQRSSEAGAVRPAQDRTGPPRPGPSPLLLKWFFFLMSIGLTVTTLLGIYMAFQYNRDRRMIWSLLVVGTALPIVLLLF